MKYTSPNASSDGYRPEIDGLRALAVLSAVFYHASVAGFPGGFVGVDVFYVISGFLITSIIAKDIALGHFSFLSFYERRIRRIFPALFAMVFCTLLAAAIFLMPTDFKAFGKSLVALSCFVSNIYFRRDVGERGYFGDSSEKQALLHSWSLSVEEQFYLFFPAALILLTRFAKRWVKPGVLLALLLSFAINLWATQNRPVAAFYLLPPRIWELLIGSVLAMQIIPLLRHQLLREILSLLGLGLILWAVFMLSKDSIFPGVNALLPCVGTALIIYTSGNGTSCVKKLLSWRPFVFIGVISYSLYLWHWPIIVFSKYFAAGILSQSAITLIVIASLAVAFLSFEFIESPFRGATSKVSRKQVFRFGFAASIICAVLGSVIYLQDGLPGRYDAHTNELITKNVNAESDYQYVCDNWQKDVRSISDIKFCQTGSASKNVMFMGDSHVLQLYPLIQQLYSEGYFKKYGTIFAIATGCPPAEHMNRTTPGFHCDAFTHFALQRALEDDIKIVYIGFSMGWALPEYPKELCPTVDGQCVKILSRSEQLNGFLEEIKSQILTLKLHHKKVIMALPFPLYDRSISGVQMHNAIFDRFGMHLAARDVTDPQIRARLQQVALETGAGIFDPRASLCKDTCITQIDGVSIYRDYSHIATSQLGILKDEIKRSLPIH